MSNLIDQCKQEWPPVFHLAEITRLTGGALRYQTICNKRSLGEIPSEIFFKYGRKTLVNRNALLDWWADNLKEISPNSKHIVE